MWGIYASSENEKQKILDKEKVVNAQQRLAAIPSGSLSICSDNWASPSTGAGTCSWHGGKDYSYESNIQMLRTIANKDPEKRFLKREGLITNLMLFWGVLAFLFSRLIDSFFAKSITNSVKKPEPSKNGDEKTIFENNFSRMEKDAVKVMIRSEIESQQKELLEKLLVLSKAEDRRVQNQEIRGVLFGTFLILAVILGFYVGWSLTYIVIFAVMFIGGCLLTGGWLNDIKVFKCKKQLKKIKNEIWSKYDFFSIREEKIFHEYFAIKLKEGRAGGVHFRIFVNTFQQLYSKAPFPIPNGLSLGDEFEKIKDSEPVLVKESLKAYKDAGLTEHAVIELKKKLKNIKHETN